MKRSEQTVLHCRCGQARVLARGMCGACYSLRRHDEEYFAGLREVILKRDGYRCRVCFAPGHAKWSIAVHHRVPGVSTASLMISLCPKCHAKVHRTRVAVWMMSTLLIRLWREQHPRGHEQGALSFGAPVLRAERMRLFD